MVKSLLSLLRGGCLAGTVLLSAAAACSGAALGTLTGLLAMGLASERAEKKSSGVGSFPACLVDELHKLRPEDFHDTRPRWNLL